MSNLNNDPSLQAFLNTQTKPSASAEDLAKLAEHTRKNPPRSSTGAAVWGGGGLIVAFFILKLVIKAAARSGNHDHYEDRSPPRPQTVNVTPAQLEDLQRLLNEPTKKQK